MKQIIYISLIIIIIFIACSKPKFELLCREEKNGKITEIYLVKNRPHDPQKLEKLMRHFNIDLKKTTQPVRRIFLKPHENGILGVIFNDQINYSKNGCDELDNMDFIYRVTKYKMYEGNDTIVYYMFTE